MARKIRLITVTGKTVTTDLYLDGAASSAETISYTEVAPQIYEGTVTAAAGAYTLNLKYSGTLVGKDRCIVGATDATTYPSDSVTLNLTGTTVRLADDLEDALQAAASQATSASSSSSAAAANTTTLLARIGAFAGIGTNTIFGFLRAIMSQAASTPGDVGGTYSAATHSLEALGETGLFDADELADAVWSNEERTLTQTASQVQTVMTGSDLEINRGSTWSHSISDLPSLDEYDKIWLTVKKTAADPDSKAALQIELTEGLLVLAGSSSVTAGDAAMTIDGTTLSFRLEAASSLALWQGQYVYDIKGLQGSDVIPIQRGRADVVNLVTHAIE